MSGKGRYVYEWPRPAHTADVALLRPGAPTSILLIRRAREPFAGLHALPGGFVDPDEEALDAARRELAEETGLAAPPLAPLMTLDRPGRDPRGRTVTQVFVGVVDDAAPVAGDDAAEAGWFPLDDPPPLAFDHAEVIGRLRALRGAGPADPALERVAARLRAAR